MSHDRAVPLMDEIILQGIESLFSDQKESVAFLVEIAALFQATAPEHFTKLVAALQARDSVNVRLHSHRLKGSALNLGASALGRFCEGLESEARQGRIADDVGAVTEALRKVFSETCMEIHRRWG